VKEITPPQAQLIVQVLSKAGMFVMRTVGAPGFQGAGSTGKHGIGVSTPRAAAVADATVGLAKDVHTPNGGTLVIGIMSVMTPATIMLVCTGRTVATKLEGAAPKVHNIMAPVQTCWGISIPPGRSGGAERPRAAYGL
jgi:hypothetical protein